MARGSTRKATERNGRKGKSPTKRGATGGAPRERAKAKGATKAPKQAMKVKPPKSAKPKVASASPKSLAAARASEESIREAIKGTPTRPGKPRTRVTARTPVGADELKARIGELMTATSKIRSLRRGLTNNFYDIGEILHDIEAKRLYEAKGYSSFEAFIDREVDLGKQQSFQVLRISQTLLRDAALEAGLERATAAVAALDGGGEAPEVTPAAPAPNSAPFLRRGPAIPLHKR